MRRALLVGIDDYDFARLSGCVNDAKNMKQVLSRNEDESRNFYCKVLTAPAENITRSFLREQIMELFAYDADVTLFYFAGHGTFDNLGGYLVTQDAAKYDEGVAIRDVLLLANKAKKIREVVIILDCCHSGFLGSIPEIDNEKAILREGVSVLTASRSSQTAAEIGGSGLFTTLICAALEGGYADVCGNVTVASVYAYVDQALGAWEQRPLFKSHVSTLIPLRKCKPAVELSILRMITKYFPTPDFEFKLDPSYEPDAEPRNPEHEKIFYHLQMYRSARLVEPVGAEHMYFAAMNSKSCKLTPIGQFNWCLAERGKI
ncbi:MAG: caspase domain-containing protein [Candidatus Hodarchaeota archaeon]